MQPPDPRGILRDMSADPYTDETSATQRFSRSASASERLREGEFPIVVRGYHRQTVDLFIAELLELVEALEAVSYTHLTLPTNREV